VDPANRIVDYTEEEIAPMLNAKGFRSGTGQPFKRSLVFRLRKTYKLVDRFTRLRNAGMLTLEEMAQRLNLCSCSVKDWRDLGWLQAHRYNDRGECLYELPGSDLPRKGAWGLRKYRATEVPSNRAEACSMKHDPCHCPFPDGRILRQINSATAAR
jgi:hypothetical protein